MVFILDWFYQPFYQPYRVKPDFQEMTAWFSTHPSAHFSLKLFFVLPDYLLVADLSESSLLPTSPNPFPNYLHHTSMRYAAILRKSALLRAVSMLKELK